MKKLMIIVVMIMNFYVYTAENKQLLEFCSVADLSTAIIQWHTTKNAFPMVYRGDYSFKETYTAIKKLKNCVMVFDSGNKITTLDWISLQELEKSTSTVELRDNTNANMDKDVLAVINKNNKSKILVDHFMPLKGRSVLFFMNFANNYLYKTDFFNEINKLLNDDQTKVFIVVDSKNSHADEIKNLFYEKNKAFIFHEKK